MQSDSASHTHGLSALFIAAVQNLTIPKATLAMQSWPMGIRFTSDHNTPLPATPG